MADQKQFDLLNKQIRKLEERNKSMELNIKSLEERIFTLEGKVVETARVFVIQNIQKPETYCMVLEYIKDLDRDVIQSLPVTDRMWECITCSDPRVLRELIRKGISIQKLMVGKLVPKSVLYALIDGISRLDDTEIRIYMERFKELVENYQYVPIHDLVVYVESTYESRKAILPLHYLIPIARLKLQVESLKQLASYLTDLSKKNQEKNQ
jgi:hypothetical protein